MWNSTNSVFQGIVLPSTTNAQIVSVIPADYDYDGKTDLLITYKRQDPTTSAVTYMIEIRLMNCASSQACTYTVFNADNPYFSNLDPIQPFLIDLDGSKYPQIFVSINQTRYLLTELVVPADPEANTTQQPVTYTIKEFQKYIKLDQTETADGLIDNPIVFNALDRHYATLTDFTGDCKADLVMMSETPLYKTIEFYKNLGGRLAVPIVYSVSSTVASFAFSDVNFDGAVDLILLYNPAGSNPFVQTHFNKYPSKASDMCVENSNFPFDMGELVSGNLKKIQRIMLPGTLPPETSPTLRFWDLNVDGYPDLLMGLVASQGQNTIPTSNFYYLENTQCFNESCGAYNPQFTFYSNVTNMRYLKYTNLSTFAVSNVRLVAPFDFFQDGRPDFIVNYYQQKRDGTRVHYLQPILNNKHADAFFLKLLTLNGYNDSKQSSSMFGVTYEWKITTLAGEFVHAVATQRSTLCYESLQLPFALTGLGRTNNYVEDLYIGLSQSGQNYLRKWTPIVPNSQLIVTTPTEDPANWKISVYIEPTEKLKTVFEITVLALIAVGLMIYYYHSQQKKQDRENLDDFYAVIKG